MKQSFFIFLTLAVTIWPGALFGAFPPQTDYALMTAQPYKAEVNLAYRRLWHFLTHLNPKTRALLEQTPNVAVQAYELKATDVRMIASRLAKGKAQATEIYARNPRDWSEAQVKFLLIFDSRTRQLASPEGVLVVDTPLQGRVGVFGGLSAVYAGTGR
jgi:hypothetical protein